MSILIFTSRVKVLILSLAVQTEEIPENLEDQPTDQDVDQDDVEETD